MIADYMFVCIGTNKIISDSFGPRVGEKLQEVFYKVPKVEVWGTMKRPIHLKNAANFLKMMELNNKIVIIIDSAFGNLENIGNTYVNFGGIELGKAFGKGIYFPANINIKTIIANKKVSPKWNIHDIDFLATKVTKQIDKTFKLIV